MPEASKDTQIPVVDLFRCAPAAGREGLVVELETLAGGSLRFGLHAASLSVVIACLFDAAARLGETEPAPPAARLDAKAIGLVRSETGELLLALQGGAATLAFRLPPPVLAALARHLAEIAVVPEQSAELRN